MKNNALEGSADFSVISSASQRTKPETSKTDFPLPRHSQGRADPGKSVVLLGGKSDMTRTAGRYQRPEFWSCPSSGFRSEGWTRQTRPGPRVTRLGLFPTVITQPANKPRPLFPSPPQPQRPAGSSEAAVGFIMVTVQISRPGSSSPGRSLQ